jgi:hypothetical protein
MKITSSFTLAVALSLLAPSVQGHHNMIRRTIKTRGNETDMMNNETYMMEVHNETHHGKEAHNETHLIDVNDSMLDDSTDDLTDLKAAPEPPGADDGGDSDVEVDDTVELMGAPHTDDPRGKDEDKEVGDTIEKSASSDDGIEKKTTESADTTSTASTDTDDANVNDDGVRKVNAIQRVVDKECPKFDCSASSLDISTCSTAARVLKKSSGKEEEMLACACCSNSDIAATRTATEVAQFLSAYSTGSDGAQTQALTNPASAKGLSFGIASAIVLASADFIFV